MYLYTSHNLDEIFGHIESGSKFNVQKQGMIDHIFLNLLNYTSL